MSSSNTLFMLALGNGYQFLDYNGQIDVGSNLIIYFAGTTTPANTMTGVDGNALNPNPLPLDVYGRAPNEIFGFTGNTYDIVLTDSTNTFVRVWPDVPLINDVNIAPAFTAGQNINIDNNDIISFNIPQTVYEASQGIAPVQTQYPQSHILRYVPANLASQVIAGNCATDLSANAQTWLSSIQPGSTAILVGFVPAQGLVVRTSDFAFTGDGWLVPAANTSGSIIQFGEDSTNTVVQRVQGRLTVGDPNPANSWTQWPNLAGIAFQAMFDSMLDIGGRNLGQIILFNPTITGVSYNTFRLGEVYNANVGINFTTANTGFANENSFWGGRFGIKNGTYTPGQVYLQGINVTKAPNNNRFYSPSFENGAQVINWNAQNLYIRDARWEIGSLSPNVEATNFANVFFNFGSSSLSNHIEFGFVEPIFTGTGSARLNSRDFGASFAQNPSLLQVAGNNILWFPSGAVISVNVAGNTFLSSVVTSTFSAPNTTIQITNPILTSNPSNTWAVRVNDAGRINDIYYPITAAIGASGTQLDARQINRQFLSMARSTLQMTPIDAQTPCIVVSSAIEQDLLRTSSGGNITANVSALGNANFHKFAVAGMAPVSLLSVTGSRATSSNGALTNLLSVLVQTGLIVDNTTG